MELSVVKHVIKTFGRLKILVIGDVMIDEYLWGEVERISPEAPVQVLDLKREESVPGGAGNVVRNLCSLGITTSLSSVVGTGPNGEYVAELMNELGVELSSLLCDAERPTSKKTRIIAANQQVLRIDREMRRPLSNRLEQELVKRIMAVMPSQDAVLISDYGKGVLTDFVLKQIIAHAKKINIPLFVDPKGNDFSKYTGATCITPNKKEAQAATGIELNDEPDIVEAGHTLLNICGSDAILITRSHDGMTLFMKGGEVHHIPTRAKEVYDVTGAGDTVLSVLGAGVAAGLKFPQAAELANLAAGIVVAKVGTSSVSTEEILGEAAGSEPVLKKTGLLHEFLQKISLLRAEKKKIVFTNGCFDLLHVGHIKYLQKARELGDFLIVAINSDDSVKRLKGEKRPLIREDERAMILSALECVDYVLIFKEDTPLSILERIRPDILVKGGDYTKEQVVGRELVEGYGGRVELISYVDNRSSSNLINRILEKYGNGI